MSGRKKITVRWTMATLSELRENPHALRRFFIFGAVLLVALGWLVLPSWLPHHGATSADTGKGRATGPKKPAPVTDTKATPGAPAAAPVSPAPVAAPVAAVDPYAGLLGRWGGQVWLNEVRGECALTMEI